MNVNVDLMSRGQSQGEVANYLNANDNLSPGSMKPFLHLNKKTGLWTPYITIYTGDREEGGIDNPKNYQTQLTNQAATLRRDEWKQLDEAIMNISETRLNGIADLTSRGLTYKLGDAMGTTVLEWHDVSDAMEADLTMDGITRGKNDRPVYQHNYLPIPIIHVDYEINARVLSASRKMGNALDTTAAERATRKVNLKLEQMLFTDTDYGFGELDSRSRNKIYSYVNHPDRNQYTLDTAWDDSSMTGELIRADVIGMKQASLTALHFGPWVMYIPSLYETVMDEDYDVAGSSLMTIRERLLKIGGISDIKVVDTLPANTVLLVQMTSDVVRLVQGMGIQNVQWDAEGKFINKYKVLTIQVPQIRSDQNSRSGIVHAST